MSEKLPHCFILLGKLRTIIPIDEDSKPSRQHELITFVNSDGKPLAPVLAPKGTRIPQSEPHAKGSFSQSDINHVVIHYEPKKVDPIRLS